MNNLKDPVMTSIYLFFLAWFGLGYATAHKFAMIVIAVPTAYMILQLMLEMLVELNHLRHRYLINREVIRLRRLRIDLLRHRREERSQGWRANSRGTIDETGTKALDEPILSNTLQEVEPQWHS